MAPLIIALAFLATISTTPPIICTDDDGWQGTIVQAAEREAVRQQNIAVRYGRAFPQGIEGGTIIVCRGI